MSIKGAKIVRVLRLNTLLAEVCWVGRGQSLEPAVVPAAQLASSTCVLAATLMHVWAA